MTYQIQITADQLMEVVTALSDSSKEHKLSYISFEDSDTGMVLIVKYKELLGADYSGRENWDERKLVLPITQTELVDKNTSTHTSYILV